MGFPRKKESGSYTYGDYLKWPDDVRWEIIEGIAYNMSSAPSRRHRKVLIALLNEFYNYLKEKDCEVYCAPFDVRLPEGNEKDEEIKTVVQPDLAVICDRSKLDERGCKGSPDLIVEVITSSTASIDYIQKLALYEKHGVKEYWIVHPVDEVVMIYMLTDNRKYGRAIIYSKNDQVSTDLFDDLRIDLKEVFKE
ncbi:MAG TPA: Uma2 family endonuclease [Desulfotomaculum sp.]|nr:Uma2 family endonuclease [Desulfotomaculum sp.]